MLPRKPAHIFPKCSLSFNPYSYIPLDGKGVHILTTMIGTEEKE